MEDKILVPLDGSPLAETVLPHAAQLAHSTGSSLVLLRAVPRPTMPDPLISLRVSVDDMCSGQVALARDYLRSIARKLQADLLRVQTVARQGQPAQQILDYVVQDPAVKMIAMATHGRSGAARLFMGSVAEQVLQATPLPLLLLRPDQQDEQWQAPPSRPYRVIIVPLDGTPLAEQALGPAQLLASATHARLELLGVAPERGADNTLSRSHRGSAMSEPELDTYLARVAASLHTTRLTVTTQLLHGSPAQGIHDDSALTEADLIVMATHGRSTWQRMWSGSVALSVAQRATCPLLLVRDQATVYSEPPTISAS